MLYLRHALVKIIVQLVNVRLDFKVIHSNGVKELNAIPTTTVNMIRHAKTQDVFMCAVKQICVRLMQFVQLKIIQHNVVVLTIYQMEIHTLTATRQQFSNFQNVLLMATVQVKWHASMNPAPILAQN